MNKVYNCALHARHLGDYWARMNYMLRTISEIEKQYNKIHIISPENKPYRQDMCETINDLLEYPFKDKVLTKRATNKDYENIKPIKIYAPHNGCGIEAYSCKYYPTKKNWNNTKSIRNKVCVSYDSIYYRDDKTPSYLNNLDSALRESFEVVELTAPMSLPEYVIHLSECKCFLGVDAGLSQIARSIGCPSILIKHKHPVEVAHPNYFYETVSSLTEAYSKVFSYT